MPESELRKYQVTLKRRGWSTPASVTLVVVILTLWYLRPNLFLLIALSLLLLYALSLLLRYVYLQNHQLVIQGNSLIKFDSSGAEIGRLDLTQPLEVEYLFKGNQNALYKLSQGRTHMQFSAETAGAEQVVTEILQLQWPPIAYNWWPLS